MTDQTADTGDTADTAGWPALPPGARLVALVADLMDRSKVAAARPDAELVRDPAALGALSERDVALVDLGRPGALAAAESCAAHVIGFVSHVDDATADAARRAGVEVLARSAFFRRLRRGS